MILDWQTYVLQRRINRSLAHVARAIANPSVFGSGSFLTDDAAGALVLDESFRRIDTYAEPVWRATGRLLDGRHHALGDVEVEVSAWSEIDTQLLIRPRARRPDRWSGRRTRGVFRFGAPERRRRRPAPRPFGRGRRGRSRRTELVGRGAVLSRRVRSRTRSWGYSRRAPRRDQERTEPTCDSPVPASGQDTSATATRA